MSWITEVTVLGAEQPAIDALNEWLAEHDVARHQRLEPIDMEHAGGTKLFTTDVWAAAFNYLPIGFLEKLREPTSWSRCLLSVFVIVEGEEFREAFLFGTPTNRAEDDENHVVGRVFEDNFGSLTAVIE